MKTLIIIPAFNEDQNLPWVVRELIAEVPSTEILVVDDGSTDQTAQILDRLPVRSLRLSMRLGVGNAVRAGLRYAVRNGFSRAIRIDADGQHSPQGVAGMLAVLETYGWDAATGSRYLTPVRGQPFRLRRWVQSLLGKCLSVLSGCHVTDPTSGFWAFGPRAVRLLSEHYPPGYSEPELRLVLARSGLRVGEVAVPMRPRLYGQTTLTPWRTLMAILRVLLAMLLFPVASAPLTERGDG